MKTTRILFSSITMLSHLAFLAMLISCAKEKAKIRDTISIGTPVQITHPHIQDCTEYVNLNANTIFLKKEIVRATFQGFIEKIYKNIGDGVKNGDMVLTIKTKESAADDSIRIDLGAEMYQGSVQIRAHSDGVLTVLNYQCGDFVSEGEEIAVISNPSSLRISLNVPYQYIAHMNTENRCEIFLPDGKSFNATILKKIPSVDPASQTQTFLLHPDTPVYLPENLNVNARLPLVTVKDAVVLPYGAILSNETQDIFWIMKLIDDTTAVRIDLTKGIETDSLVQIIRPELTEADRIISNGAYGLPDTAKVVIIH